MSFPKLCLFFLLVVPGVIDAQLDCSIVLHGTYDYIVVGGGTSGAVIASRLSEDPDIRVLLLEAGKPDDDIFESHVIDTPGLAYSLVGSNVDWKYETEPQQFCCGGLKEQKVRLSRGRVLGGTSAIDSMEHIRGSQHVFNEWEQSGATGWNFTNVKDFFKMTEDVNIKRVPLTNHRGQCGPLHVTEQKDDSLRYSMFKAGTTEMGWPVIECNIGENIGLCRSQLTIKQGNRISSAKAYLNPVKRRVNLDIQTEAKVVKININEYNLKATGVNFIYRGKNYTINVRHDVILAAGPIETPKLLMLSGIGKPDHLAALNITVLEDLPVGNNLQDGYSVPLRMYVNVPTYRPDKPMENVQRWRDYIYLRRGELADGLTDAHFFLRTLPSKSSKYSDIAITVINMLPDNDHSLLMKMNVEKKVRDTWYKQGRGKNGVLLEMKLMHAKSRGTVRLRSADPNDPPIIDPNYLKESVDVEDLRKGVEFVQSLAKTVAFQSVSAELERDLKECENHPTNSQDYWRCYIRYLGYSSNQIVGTAKMGGLDDNTTVVDSSLRVKGITGLRVADASIMPQSTGSTRASVIMIGEKAADIIKKDLEEHRANRNNPQTFINAVKTTEPRNLDPLTSSVYDTNTSVVKLENTEPIDPVTAPLNSASETDLFSIFEQLIMDPVANPQPPVAKEAGSLAGSVDLATGPGILDKSGRLTEDALLKLVGVASGPKELTIENPAISQPTKPLDIAKAARNTVKHTQEKPTMGIATADIFSEIQNLSLNQQGIRLDATQRPPSSNSNSLKVERSRVTLGSTAKSRAKNTGATRQQSIKNVMNPVRNEISAQTRHQVIDMHSLLHDQTISNPTNKVVDMHSLLNSQSPSLKSKNSILPESLGLERNANPSMGGVGDLRRLSDSLQKSRVSSFGIESLFDHHRDAFPSTEPDVLNFAGDAGSLSSNNLGNRNSNLRRNPKFS